MFELLFAYPRDAFDHGELVFANVTESGWWILTGLLIAGILCLSLFHRRRMTALNNPQRITITALQVLFAWGVLLLISNPSLHLSLLQPGSNVVAVLIDTSRSMSFPAVNGADRSRAESALEILNQSLIPALQPDTEVVVYGFDESVSRTPADLHGTGNRTRLLDAIETVVTRYQQDPLAAVIVLSDGADNSSATTQVSEIGHGVPIHTIGLGPDELKGDIRLASIVVPDEAAVSTNVTADVVIEHALDKSTPVLLRVRDGDRLLSVSEVNLAEDEFRVRTQVTFDSGSAGIRDLQFELSVPGPDLLAGNNVSRRLLTVAERKRRVLYLEGEPRWEFKYLRRALRNDDVIELVSWLRTTDRKTYRQGVDGREELQNGLPEDTALLFDFDVVVLGSIAATDFTPEQHAWLMDFVAERGGSLLALAGRNSLGEGGWDVQPLAEALPVDIARQPSTTYLSLADEAATVVPTTTGELADLIRLSGEGSAAWSSLPALVDRQTLGEHKPAATTLLELDIQGQRQALLIQQPYGLGTTAVLATATTWRWQTRTPADDPRHRTFWRQLLRHLAELARRPRDLQVDLDPSGQLLVNAATHSGSTPDSLIATVVTPDQKTLTMDLKAEGTPVFNGSHQATLPGIYRVDVDFGEDSDSLTRFVRLDDTDREALEPARNNVLLTRISESTGGRNWPIERAGDIAEHLRYASAGIRKTENLSLQFMPVLLILLLALKLIEWLLRRRWGKI